MITKEQLRAKIKNCIIKALELDISPSDISDNASLFGSEADSLGLDSLAALEIVVGICKEFNITVSEVDQEVFMSIETISDYFYDQLKVCQAK